MLTDCLQKFYVRGAPDDCWEWQGHRNKDGYGRVWDDGWQQQAHRLVFELEYGRKPKGFVCHTCDNPACVNPAHLVDANHKWNMQDVKNKGRWIGNNAGEKHGGAKLNALQVRLIRSSKEVSGRVAEVLGVSSSLIRSIRRGERWRHLSNG